MRDPGRTVLCWRRKPQISKLNDIVIDRQQFRGLFIAPSDEYLTLAGGLQNGSPCSGGNSTFYNSSSDTTKSCYVCASMPNADASSVKLDTVHSGALPKVSSGAPSLLHHATRMPNSAAPVASHPLQVTKTNSFGARR
jgi:hypothetical protein